MGKSAKVGRKRPTRAEKAAKVINNQTVPKYPRSASPDGDSPSRSAIPLFNTSAKGRLAATQQRIAKLRGDIMSLDSSAAPSPTGSASSPDMIDIDDDDQLKAQIETPETELSFDRVFSKQTGSPAATGAKKHKSLKDKVKAAKLSLKTHSNDGKMKEGAHKKRHVLGDVDYLKLHEKKPGGNLWKKKLR